MRPRPPPFEPRDCCIFLRTSSLSSALNFQAPRIVVRGGGSGVCSWGFAADVGTDWGGAAGRGPAGAWARITAGAIKLIPPKNAHVQKLGKKGGFMIKSRSPTTTVVN